MKKISEICQLRDTVLNGNYCIGCGACTMIKGSTLKMKMNEYGNYVAYPDNSHDVEPEVKLLDVCPFSGKSKNEDQLGEHFFPHAAFDKRIGKHLKCFAGYVTEGDFREKGSSGGFGKWLGYVLLKENKIDYYIQLVSNSTKDSDALLFEYEVFSDPKEVIKGSKSGYYPTTLEKVVQIIEETEGRYAVTGIPCFIKALRLLSLRNNLLMERLRYTIGIICGGMKSANQARMIGWQLGVHPSNLIAVDFRRKYKDRPADNKIYQVWSDKDNTEHYQNERLLFGTDYGAGYFKPNACDYCDDVVGETADISLGDAWLSRYVTDPGGTSVIVVRNQELLELIEQRRSHACLYLEEIDKEDVVLAQAAGFRHRREGLSYRLAKKEKQGQWTPVKRVRAAEFSISNRRKKIYSLRETLAKQSHIAFLEALRRDDFGYFLKKMKPLNRKYIYTNTGVSQLRWILHEIKECFLKRYKDRIDI